MSLTTLFLDMNSYFASVEQQANPKLRGKPVGVVPMLAETTCCIAASYEAKRYGVKTGTGVAEARALCPGLAIVQARPELYVRTHHRIIEAVNTCLPVDGVHSIDEMSCKLMGEERETKRATELSRQVKQAIYKNVGEYLRCSVGVATNKFLAKVATEIEKPDGLVVINREDLPDILFSLKPMDLPGIGKRMNLRLEKQGITTIRQLCALSEEELVDIWQSLLGRLWWHWLRGDELRERPTHRRTVGHSHVLPPQTRTDAGARAVMVRLIHKAAARMRNIDYWAGRMQISVRYFGKGSWSDDISLGLCQDTSTMLEAFTCMWAGRPRGVVPVAVAMTLYNLVADASAPAPLFADERKRLRLSKVIDDLNAKFGRHTLYFGGMHTTRSSAPTRISFTNIPDLQLQV